MDPTFYPALLKNGVPHAIRPWILGVLADDGVKLENRLNFAERQSARQFQDQAPCRVQLRVRYGLSTSCEALWDLYRRRLGASSTLVANFGYGSNQHTVARKRNLLLDDFPDNCLDQVPIASTSVNYRPIRRRVKIRTLPRTRGASGNR